MVDQELPEMEPLPLEPDEQPEPVMLPMEEEPIQLTETPVEAGAAPKIRAFGAGHGLGPAGGKEYRRPLNLTGTGATRCKIFHSKIAVAPMEYMEQQINEWIDANEIEIKAVTQVVGVLEGKTAEPNIIAMVWY